jgi:hypothetical protein
MGFYRRIMTRLDSPAHAAILEAKRLDDQEAPQREAARVASEREAARDKLEMARLVNKPFTIGRRLVIRCGR